MPNSKRKLGRIVSKHKALIDIIAFLTGTRDDWEQQFREQNKNLAAFAQGAL